jgi:hypothetical protein
MFQSIFGARSVRNLKTRHYKIVAGEPRILLAAISESAYPVNGSP